MNRTTLLLVALLEVTINTSAQTPPCAFDAPGMPRERYAARTEAKYQQWLREEAQGARSSDTRIIPVVVHVVHNGGPENISDAQIISQIQVLNEDYGKLPGTNGDGDGVDTRIRFCLAKISPDGHCTNGIVRVKSTLTDHQSFERSLLKQLSFWDNDRYLNIYVVQDIDNNSGTLGYSSFPDGPDDEDGFVVKHVAFGTTGTAQAPYNMGRTASHELGHWLGLYHTFNGGCGTDTCTTGDLVCDTPPVADPNFGCPLTANSCSNEVPDVTDQVRNYMDYTNDACKNLFTVGQRDRAQGMLDLFRWDIWQPSNTWSTGCDSSYVSPDCAVVAAFTTLGQSLCTGNSVEYISTSLNDPLTYQWYFPGGVPSTSTTQNTVVNYAAPGTYSATLVVSDGLTTDSLTVPGYITVADPTPGIALPFHEDFEGSDFPPQGITIDNPDLGITWVRDPVAVMYEGIAAARIDNLTNTNYGQIDALVLPRFDMTTFSGTPYLTFRWAYARSDANYSDRLSVLVSTDCGVTYTQVFTRTGAAMATGPTQITPYVPDSTTNWKLATVNLNAYAASDHLIIRIINVTDGGNYLYVDHINLGEQWVGIEDQAAQEPMLLYPNPTDGLVRLRGSLDIPANARVVVSDVHGRTVLDQNWGRVSALGLDLSALVDGVYLVRVPGNRAMRPDRAILRH